MSDFELTNPIGSEVEDADTRLTPAWLFGLLNHEFGFGIDAAATQANALCPVWLGPDSPIAKCAVRAPDSAWCVDRMPVFVNPPFSRMADFTAKAASVCRSQRVPIAMIMPGDRHEQPWFHSNVLDVAAEVRCPVGRVKYNGTNQSPEWPSFVVIYKPWHVGPTIIRELKQAR